MVTARALMVMPRSFSSSMLSSNCSARRRSSTLWVFSRIRSASVLLPWSICAMMQKLRIFFFAKV
ncbi:hypothetical protein EVA_12276 [gut metagenome]|uniref:Uncharacterized protein n=1 Tax=gut metagenome TaxID=749906 RepID=J9CHU6_9ZZZZ